MRLVETLFADLDDSLVVVNVALTGPRGARTGRFVLDTGAAMTTMTPQMAAGIGYGVRDRFRRTRVQAALGAETGYMVHVAEFAALGFALHRFSVNVFALAGMHVDGRWG